MPSPSLTLYVSPGSCAIVPQILLHYAGLAYKPIGIPLHDLGEKFYPTNPKGQVPVLLWDKEMITELPAIAHTINHLQPGAKIFGQGPLQLVRVCEWLNFLSGALHAQTWGAFARPYRFTDEPQAEEGVKRKALEKLRDRFSLIESKLPPNGWVVGDNLTAVDPYLLAISQWARKRAGFDLDHDYPKWASLVKRVEAEDAVQKALSEEKRIAEELGV